MSKAICAIGSALALGAALALGPAPAARAAEKGATPEKATQAAPPAVSETLTARTYKLVVGTVGVAPSSPNGVEEGSMVRLSIEVRNDGPAAAPAGHTLSIHCRVVSGGPDCPVPDSEQPLEAIPAGQSQNLVLIAATGAQPGDYRLAFRPDTQELGRSRTVEIHVFPKLKLIDPGKLPAIQKR